jgi:hypothetical protein
LRRAKTITIYATRTGGREPISKAREERKEEAGVEVLSRVGCECKSRESQKY